MEYYQNFQDQPYQDDTVEQPEDFQLPERKLTPYRKKQLDYKHRRVAVYGKSYRKVSRDLPLLERRQYRRAQNAVIWRIERDGEAELTSADAIRAIKRSHYRTQV